MHGKHPAIVQLSDIADITANAFYAAKGRTYYNVVFLLKEGEYAKVAQGMLLTDGVTPRYLLIPRPEEAPEHQEETVEEPEEEKSTKGKKSNKQFVSPNNDGVPVKS